MPHPELSATPLSPDEIERRDYLELPEDEPTGPPLEPASTPEPDGGAEAIIGGEDGTGVFRRPSENESRRGGPGHRDTKRGRGLEVDYRV